MTIRVTVRALSKATRAKTCIVKLMAATFEANDRSYRAPGRPVLAICADGWDPEYVDDALERALMPRLARDAPGRRQLRARPRPGADVHQPQQRRDRHWRAAPPATASPATTTATSAATESRSPTRPSCGPTRSTPPRHGSACARCASPPRTSCEAAGRRRRAGLQRRARARADAWTTGPRSST